MCRHGSAIEKTRRYCIPWTHSHPLGVGLGRWGCIRRLGQIFTKRRRLSPGPKFLSISFVRQIRLPRFAGEANLPPELLATHSGSAASCFRRFFRGICEPEARSAAAGYQPAPGDGDVMTRCQISPQTADAPPLVFWLFGGICH